VNATALPPSNAPIITIIPARSTALFGVAALQAIMVATIALASWNPLVNENASIRTIAINVTMSMLVALSTFEPISVHIIQNRGNDAFRGDVKIVLHASGLMIQTAGYQFSVWQPRSTPDR
jgi:hypothetical protein